MLTTSTTYLELRLSTSLRKNLYYLKKRYRALTLVDIRMIPLWSIPFALATGNTLVLKPSERTTGASMIIAECVILLTIREPITDLNLSRVLRIAEKAGTMTLLSSEADRSSDTISNPQVSPQEF